VSKESLQAGLGVRFHSAYRPSREESKGEETLRAGRPFTPEQHDLDRLLPRLRERQRRMS
jgi:hypothetical protein